MTEKQLDLAKHAIGLSSLKKAYRRHGRYFYRPYRNYFYANANSLYAKTWEELRENGYADRNTGSKNIDGHTYYTYWLTRKGLDEIGKQLNVHIYDESD